MTQAVLELNDYALNLYQDGELTGSSPGYALALAGKTHFGATAAEQSRLHPVNTHNEFWHRLGMDPLTRPLAHYRHNADVAHAHLLDFAASCDFQGEVLLAVPGSYSRQQLSVLGGIMQHSPFKAAAMMDAGLFAAVAGMGEHEHLVYVDMQLHQFSLSLVTQEQQQLRRKTVSVVQGAGWNKLSNTLVQVINDAFIEQSRFNPQHSAFWEQHLYNELPDYLQQIRGGQSDLLVTITTDKATHQARISAADLINSLQPAFGKILQQVQQLAEDTTIPVLLSERAAMLPGLQRFLDAGSLAVTGENMALACLQAGAALPANGSQMPYITSWQADAAAPAVSVPSRPNNPPPSHILLSHQAWPLDKPCYLSRDGHIRYDRAHNAVLTLQPDSNGITASAIDHDVWLNGKPLSNSTRLAAGDRITVHGSADSELSLQLIRVQHGQGELRTG